MIWDETKEGREVERGGDVTLDKQQAGNNTNAKMEGSEMHL